jgi:hypothetical protein
MIFRRQCSAAKAVLQLMDAFGDAEAADVIGIDEGQFVCGEHCIARPAFWRLFLIATILSPGLQ